MKGREESRELNSVRRTETTTTTKPDWPHGKCYELDLPHKVPVGLCVNKVFIYCMAAMNTCLWSFSLWKGDFQGLGRRFSLKPSLWLLWQFPPLFYVSASALPPLALSTSQEWSQPTEDHVINMTRSQCPWQASQGSYNKYNKITMPYGQSELLT